MRAVSLIDTAMENTQQDSRNMCFYRIDGQSPTIQGLHEEFLGENFPFCGLDTDMNRKDTCRTCS